MTRHVRNHRLAAELLIGLVVLSCASGARCEDLPSIAAGIKAGFTCSGVFLAGRSPEDVAAQELEGMDPALKLLPDAVVDFEHKAVTCVYAKDKPPRLAVYRQGFGAILTAPGTTLDDLDALPKAEIPTLADDPSKMPWPDGDLLSDEPLPPEVDKKKLDAAIEAAFTGEQYRPHFTIGVVVVYKGRIIGERYAAGWGMHTQYRTWSTAKSLTNAMVGIMVRRGKLNVKDRVPIPEWQGKDDQRRQITIENLLHMSSGLKSEGAMTKQAYWGGINTAEDLVKSPLEAPPGTRWKYANYDTLLLMLSIRNVLGDDQQYWALPRAALLNKIGMRDTTFEIDSYGNFISSSQIYTTPRDLARFGLLYLNDGVWNGQRILPEGWVAYTIRPAPAKPKADYGAQFWLIGTDERLPDDAFTTSGARGQHSTIVPSRHLVVARMGLDPLEKDGWSQERFVADILAAISAVSSATGPPE